MLVEGWCCWPVGGADWCVRGGVCCLRRLRQTRAKCPILLQLSGDAECWALLSTGLVECGSASRAGAAWWVLLLCWERFSEKLNGGLAIGVVCDFCTLALGCFLCSIFGYGAQDS